MDDNFKNKIKEENFKNRNKSMNILIYPELSSNNNIIDTNSYENSKIKSINYNYYYQNNFNYNNNYFNKNKDNISNNYSSKSKNNSLIFIKKKLKLKNIFGDLFKKNFVIIINEYGIENFTPLRQKYDRITKFGPIIYNNENNKDVINDIQIFTVENSIKTLFTIKYDLNNKNYFFIPNINNPEEFHELNTFIKLEQDLPIKQKYYISLGKANFSAEPINNNNSLEIKIYLNNGEIELYLFDTKKNLIKIGRSKTCDIILKSVEYSRVQTCIYYNHKEKMWYVRDGIGDNMSMNGTWLFINFPWEISYDTKIRIGKNLLELSLI